MGQPCHHQRMASNPHKSDLTQCSAEELLAALRKLRDGRGKLGAPIIRELQHRDVALNKIAADAGLPRTTVQRWAGKVEPE